MSVGSIGLRRYTSNPAARASRTPNRSEKNVTAIAGTSRPDGCARPSNEFQTVLTRQLEIAHDDVDRAGAQDLSGLRRGGGGDDANAVGFEGGGEQLN